MVTLLAGIGMLVSCKATKADDLKVTFMVEDDESSEWMQTAEYTAENGEVELPSVSRRYYTFANWYENKEFSGAPFTGKNVTKSLTVYARFIPVEVNVHINGVSSFRSIKLNLRKYKIVLIHIITILLSGVKLFL